MVHPDPDTDPEPGTKPEPEADTKPGPSYPRSIIFAQSCRKCQQQLSAGSASQHVRRSVSVAAVSVAADFGMKNIDDVKKD